MKVYQVNNQEFFFSDASVSEEVFALRYEKIFRQLLSPITISNQRLCEMADLSKSRFSGKERYTLPLLQRSTLPLFKFLIFKN